MRATPRAALRTLTALGLAASAVVGPSVAFADGSAPAPAPVVSILSPADLAQVSGTVQVTVRIQAPAGDPVTSVDVRLDGANYVGMPTPTFTLPLAPGECDVTCTKTFSVDTAETLPTIAGATPASLFSDYNLVVSVAAHTARAEGFAGELFRNDNHLPFVYPASGGSAGGKSTTVDVGVGVSPTAAAGTSISDVQLITPDSALTTPVHLTPTGHGAVWQAVVDTMSLSAGRHPAEIVAVDSAGHISTPIPVTLLVEHGFTLLARPTSDIYLPDESPFLVIDYTGLAGCPSALAPLNAPRHLDVRIDGTPWHAEDLTMTGENACAVSWDGRAWPLPTGRHRLAVTLTDADGYTAQWAQQITVVRPLKVSTPGATVLVPGSVFRPKVTVSSQDGISHVQSWKFTLGTTVLAHGQYPTPPSLRWTTPVNKQVHGTVVFTATSNFGLTVSTGMRLDTRWLTAVFLTAGNRGLVGRGQPGFLDAAVWQRIGTTWSRTYAGGVLLEWRPASGGAWHVPPVADPTRVGLQTQRLYQPACFRVVTVDLNVDFDAFFDSVSNTVCFSPR
ncbi:hypothetical protein ABIA32_001313 [Streptacidiphilus sp. MAP12-20]|uniref:Ig-like domain-containing protein n=1 Tax=Streptacidiphilus sp. MAP12-20 TaxID=3156299 RepID=UPI00351618AE